MTAIFSTTVTQAQRDACDYNLRGRAISQASRQNTKRPGWNAPDKYVEPTKMFRQIIETQDITVGKPKSKQEVKKVSLKPRKEKGK